MLNTQPQPGRYAVVTPWLDHNREWGIRFVGTLSECDKYLTENYGADSGYATITDLPDATHTYKPGHIIPRTR